MRTDSDSMNRGSTPKPVPLQEHVQTQDAVVAMQNQAATRHALTAHFVDVFSVSDELLDELPDDRAGEMQVALAVIPRGAFFMGSPLKEFARQAWEGPQHKVTVARDFALMRHAVTLDDYRRFCAEAGYPRPRRYSWNDGHLPVFNVSFVDAQAYAEWLSIRTGQRYRLPTEAEWEYAARAGTETAFAFGDKIHRSEVNCSGGLHCTRGFYFCGLSRPVTVGSLPANAWGLHEMHGNMQELVLDHWRESYSGIPRVAHEPWLEGDVRLRVVRGGSWFDAPGMARSAARWYRDRAEFDLNLSFRLVRELAGVV